MNEPAKELVQPDKQPAEKQTEVIQPALEKLATPEKCTQPPRRRKPLPWVKDWEFWRFLMAALSLAWEIAKTFVR